MKPLTLVLVTSMAANAVLLGFLAVTPSLAPPSIRGIFDFKSLGQHGDNGAQAESKPIPPGKKVEAALAGRWESLHSSDLSTLVARLRAAGFPPSVLRAVVDAQVEARFAPRLKELTRELNDTPYWKADRNPYMINSRFESINQIYRERSQVLRDLLGQDALAWGGVDPTAAQRRQFGDITPAKIDMVQRINNDYADMIGQIRAGMQGVALPEDRDKIALLEREKRADLAAVLTPAEMVDYEMRSSPLTSRLRTPLSIMEASEAEFRTIFAIQQPYSDVLAPTAMMVASDLTKRRDATQTVNDQIKAALGDARFADYQRATTSEFQQLYRMASAEGIGYDAMSRAFDLRDSTAAASTAIVNDRALSPAEKQTALKNLAQTTRTAILSTLGPGVGPNYAESARWLTHVEQGGSVSIQPDGNVSFRRTAPTQAPTSAPKN